MLVIEVQPVYMTQSNSRALENYGISPGNNPPPAWKGRPWEVKWG